MYKMKKLFFSLSFFAVMAIFTSCSETCVRCSQFGNPEVQTEEFCSTSKHDRNQFIVKWTHDGYNCEQIEK